MYIDKTYSRQKTKFEKVENSVDKMTNFEIKFKQKKHEILYQKLKKQQTETI